jgi:hypothetical protein
MCLNSGHLIFGNLNIDGIAYPKKLAWSGLEKIEEFPSNLSPISELTIKRCPTDDTKIQLSDFSYKVGSNVRYHATATLTLSGSAFPTPSVSGPVWRGYRFAVNDAGTIDVLAPLGGMGTAGGYSLSGAYVDSKSLEKALVEMTLSANTIPLGYTMIQVPTAAATWIPNTDALQGGVAHSNAPALSTLYTVDLPSLYEGLGLNESDVQDMPDINGPIYQLVNAGPFFYIIGRDSISTGRYTGYPYIYEFKPNIVMDFPIVSQSFIMVNNIGYMLSSDGIYSIDFSGNLQRLVEYDSRRFVWNTPTVTTPGYYCSDATYNTTIQSIFWKISYDGDYSSFIFHLPSKSITFMDVNSDPNFVTALGGRTKIAWKNPEPFITYYNTLAAEVYLNKCTLSVPSQSGSSALIYSRLLFSESNSVLTITKIKLVGRNNNLTSSYVNVSVFYEPMSNRSKAKNAVYNPTTDTWDIVVSGRNLQILVTMLESVYSAIELEDIAVQIEETATR